MKKVFMLLALFSATVSFGQQGYNIEMKIKHLQDTSLYMTTYFGDKIRIVDTAYAQKPETFVFKGDKPLAGGIYMAVNPKKVKLFEFVVNKKQNLVIIADTNDFTNSVKVKNSPENRVFYDYLLHNKQIYEKIAPLTKALDTLDKSGDRYNEIKKEIDSLNKVSVDYKLNLIKKYPDLLVARILNGMREVEVPKDTLHTDSLFAYHYLKKHYWDNFDLSDPRLLHTPLYSKKVVNYFDRMVPMDPDSAIEEIDALIAKARPSKQNVSWLVWHFTVKYQNPKYMGFDKVFVHMVDQYFAKEEIDNTTESIKKLLTERADKLRPLLIGKPAPELILMDTSGRYIGFKSLQNKYTLLLFWDYKCGICKREIEHLKKFYKNRKYDVEVYAININPELDKWKKAVRDRKLPWINVNGTRSAKGNYSLLYDVHGTPVIYLLDKDKKIIAKQLSAEHINDFLDHYEKDKKG